MNYGCHLLLLHSLSSLSIIEFAAFEGACISIPTVRSICVDFKKLEDAYNICTFTCPTQFFDSRPPYFRVIRSYTPWKSLKNTFLHPVSTKAQTLLNERCLHGTALVTRLSSDPGGGIKSWLYTRLSAITSAPGLLTVKEKQEDMDRGSTAFGKATPQRESEGHRGK